MIIIFFKSMANWFIALTPQKDLNKKIIEFKSKQKKFLVKDADVNWSADNQHHVTLNYIGSMEPEQKEEMFVELDTCSFSYKELPLEITTFSYFPNENGQFLVANIFLSNQLQKLYNEVGEIVARIGFGMTLRSFKPHITLARFKERKRPFLNLIDLEGPVASSVFSIDVYKSEFKSGKTVHSLIKSIGF